VKNALFVVAMTMACCSVGSLAPAPALGAEPAAAAAAEQPEEELQVAKEEHFLSFFGVAIGVAFTIIGAAYGISKIASSAVENMARQPEASGNMQMAMIITTAMIEGIAFFALIICLLELFS